MGGAFLWKTRMESGISISDGILRAVYRSAFTIEAGDGTAGCIAKEIFSFVSAAVPEQCAREWMIQSGSNGAVGVPSGRFRHGGCQAKGKAAGS